MIDPWHRYAQGTDSGRFAAGPATSARSRFGTGDVKRGTVESLTDEGAVARCATATGPAVRIPSEAALRWRKDHPRIVRIEQTRVHGSPPALPPGQHPLPDHRP